MREDATCDTSVLVAAVLSWHPEHQVARAALRERVATIPGHALVELYSVLTRLPAPHRLAPEAAAVVVESLPLDVCVLPAEQHRGLMTSLARAGIRGGAVYDALIGATAAHHDLTLLTRDRRARVAYDAVGARYAIV